MSMGMPVEKPRSYTVSEYLRIERDSTDKHEYRDGQILAMAGGTGNHSLIALNVGGELRSRLNGKPCRAYNSDLRIRIPRTPLYTYPDVSVICGPSRYDPNDPHNETATNPRLLVEVLSPSTEGYDRGEKFSRYRMLDSLEEYVLVSQDTPRVETFFRRPDGAWLFTPVTGLESSVRLASIEIEIPLAEIYANVEFPPPAEPEPDKP